MHQQIVQVTLSQVYLSNFRVENLVFTENDKMRAKYACSMLTNMRSMFLKARMTRISHKSNDVAQFQRKKARCYCVCVCVKIFFATTTLQPLNLTSQQCSGKTKIICTLSILFLSPANPVNMPKGRSEHGAVKQEVAQRIQTHMTRAVRKLPIRRRAH